MKNLTLVFITLFMCLISSHFAFGQNVLFVRGGAGSGGFLEGGSDEQLSDINNFQTFNGNHGWGSFAQTLTDAGYTVTQIEEGSGGDAGVNFANLNLSQYAIIVLGSNNATYNTTQANTLETWVRNGGGLLTISDANFGSSWCDAPTSDQAFLSRFGIIVNQDQGTYVLRASDNDFLAPNHPVLEGISAFDGEGVSPFTVASTIPEGVEVTRLVRVKAGEQIRLNNATTGNCRGTSETANNNEAVVIAATAGSGRVLGHFDRNTFFNVNGAGTNINRFDNRQLALNMFAWLSEGVTPPNDPAEIETVRLINADTDKIIGTIVNNSQINLDIVNNANLSLNIFTNPSTVDNVQIEMSGPLNVTRTDNSAPYTLYNTNGSDFSGAQFLPGTYTLTITPFAGGEAGITSNIQFTVIGGTPPDFEASVDALRLINADTDKTVGTLVNNSQINLDLVNNADLSVNAITNPQTVGSVSLALSGPLNSSRTVNEAPYTLFPVTGSDFTGRQFPTGSYTLTVTPFENANLQGTQGTTRTITFTVIGSNAPPPPPSTITFTLINATSDNDVIPLRNGNTLTARYSMNVNIRANTANGNVESIRFMLSGPNTFNRTENDPPYALFGNIGDDY